MPSMYEIYRRHRAEYDQLVAAEDHARHLPEFLNSIVDWRGKAILEGGLGTGRVTEMYIELARRVTGFDLESHMLAASRSRLARFADKLELRPADNLDLPLLSEKADLFIEGWSWGHSIVDGPGPVAAIAEALFENIRKNLVADGFVILIETLGTNCTLPVPPHPRLEEFYRLLEDRYGLQKTALSTDYQFSSPQDAAATLGFFFGESMQQAILSANSCTIPEWTGLWHGPVPP
jgi:SAM-dependent methyltransferase